MAIRDLIVKNLRFEPTAEQGELIGELADFVSGKGERRLFILSGYAGTGKTSVVGALVRALAAVRKPVVLAAPTGRAAKVLSASAGRDASTIHRLVYRRKSKDASSRFVLDYNKLRGALFIIDEVSMLAAGGSDSDFGSGDLMNDLLEYVYSGAGCSMLFVGDSAQLPPVMYEESPALDMSFMEGYGLDVKSYSLTQVVRQQSDSGILQNATMLRNCLLDGATPHFTRFEDVEPITGAELIECLDSSYSRVGEDETIIISRSNKRAGIFAAGVRGSILQREGVISRGDLLMVVRNNYNAGLDYGVDFIANGDLAKVSRLGGTIMHHGFAFRKVSLYFPDLDCEMETMILQDSLSCENPKDLQDLSRRLYATIEKEDYSTLRSKAARFKKMMEDPFINALQVKSAYAVTCHKAQGGQWKHVYVDMAAIARGPIDASLLRYLYTTFTRATEKLYLINTPQAYL